MQLIRHLGKTAIKTDTDETDTGALSGATVKETANVYCAFMKTSFCLVSISITTALKANSRRLIGTPPTTQTHTHTNANTP